jgi:hypothetical protein
MTWFKQQAMEQLNTKPRYRIFFRRGDTQGEIYVQSAQWLLRIRENFPAVIINHQSRQIVIEVRGCSLDSTYST